MTGKKVLYVSSEVIPYLPNNDISTLSYSLPKMVNENGGQTRIFIPKYGIAGAANATMVAAVCTFIAHFVLAQKHYRLPIGLPRLMVILGAMLFSIYWIRAVI